MKNMDKISLVKKEPVKMQQRLMVEFRQARKDCLWAYRKFVMDNPWFSRKQLKTQAEDFRPVYVPCAVFDGRVEGDPELPGDMHTEDENNDYFNEFTTKARLKFAYEKVQISRASSFPSWIVRVKPEDLVPCTGEKKTGVIILSEDRSKENAAVRAREEIAWNARANAVRALEKKRRYTRYRKPDLDLFMNLSSVTETGNALLPAWILKDKKKTTIVNGVTGDVLAAPYVNVLRLLVTGGYISLFTVALLWLLFIWIGTGILSWIPALAVGVPLTFLAVWLHARRRLRKAEPDGVPFQPVHQDVKVLSHTVSHSWKSSKNDD